MNNQQIPTGITGREINLVEQKVVRFESARRSESVSAPKPFDSERAGEILGSTGMMQTLENNMTDEEIAFVKCVWDVMPGNTCFYDAVCRIYQKLVWQIDGTYYTAPKIA